MGAVAWNEMQPDPAIGPLQPFLYQLGVMIAGVVEKDVDQHHQRIERFERFEQRDRRGSIDGLHVDHPGLSGFEVDRAMNIDAVAPAGLFDREVILFGRPAADRSRRMGRWTASANSTTSSLPKEFNSLS